MGTNKRLGQMHHAQEVAQQAMDDALKNSRSEDKPVYEWEFSASEIANSIASQFFVVTSLSHADLRRKITRAIENERCIVRGYHAETND